MTSINDYVQQNYPIQCKGRDMEGNEVLKEPVLVVIKIYKNPCSNMLATEITCRYNTGEHGERCKASHSEVICPYAIDLPYNEVNRY